MTARRTVEAEGVRYLVADEDRASAERLTGAVLRCRVIDELTLEAPGAPLMISGGTPGIAPRVGAGGICGFTAQPRDLATALIHPGAFQASVSAPGYLRRDITPAIDDAHRTLTTGALAGDLGLSVSPPDPAPRRQFGAGRGVLLERTAPDLSEQFTLVAEAPAPVAPNAVPLQDGVEPARSIGAGVVGVPIAAADQPLHRDRLLTLSGRVQMRVPPNLVVPATGAAITLTGIWWDYPATISSPPRVPDLCIVEPPLRFPLDVGAPVHQGTLAPAGAPGRLDAQVAPSAKAIIVSPNGGLNPLGGDLLRIGQADSDEEEVVVTDGFDAATDPSAPVAVRLRSPAGFIHRAGERVQRVTPSAIAPIGAIAREGQPGDAVLFASGSAALPTVSMLLVGVATPHQSWHRARQLPVSAPHLVPVDGSGRFVWPPLGRVAQLRILISRPPAADVTVDLALNYASDPTLAVILT